jgi:hypothetical protein
VRLPTRSFWSVSTGVIAPVQIALLPSVFLVAILFIQFAVVRPVRRLTAAAGRISVGEQADLGVGRISRESGKRDTSAYTCDRTPTRQPDAGDSTRQAAAAAGTTAPGIRGIRSGGVC